jgi:hypothetical protein
MQKSLIRDAIARIQELLDDVLAEPVRPIAPIAAGADLALDDASGRRWLFEVKSSAGPRTVSHAAAQLQRLAERPTRAAELLPVLVVPYMTPAGERAARAADANWIDLSGNASIRARGLRVLISGRPNAYRRAGRPSSPFAPRSARIARTLLLDPARWWRQKDLAAVTGLDDGQVSRVVRRLRDERLLAERERRVRPADAGDLLEAWSDDYRFDRHDVLLGHVSGSGIELAHGLAGRLRAGRVRHAFTGLPAAWLLDRFASFRLVSVYVDGDPRDAGAAVGLRSEPRGANVQLIGPDDIGVFAGASAHNELDCVSPAQVYLDLRHLPERALDAAEHLWISQGWSGDGG